MTSVTTTLVTASGPLLVSVTVNVASEPRLGVCVGGVIASDKSAAAGASTVAESKSSPEPSPGVESGSPASESVTWRCT